MIETHPLYSISPENGTRDHGYPLSFVSRKQQIHWNATENDAVFFDFSGSISEIER